jgi:molybdate transport system ATP-binding protein
MGLSVKLSKSYKNFHLKLSLDNEGRPLGLLGASGCGKSLTLKCIAGIVTPDEGRIVLNDRILYDSKQKINLPARERKIGLLFQNYALFPNMTVRENIMAGISDKQKQKLLVERFAFMLHLESKLDQYPGQLSGGEQQRVSLARMLASEPKALLFDEPFSALDSFLKDQLQRELMEVLKEYSGDIIMVSHSRDELYRFCDRIAVIHQGILLEHGKKEDIFQNCTELTTAKLTGCKNISRARRRSEYLVEAVDWGICLKTAQPVKEDVCYVGIRAHNLCPSLGAEQENTMQVTLEGVSEGPFENQIILSYRKGQEKAKLIWIISRRDWSISFGKQAPSYISLPKEALLLLCDHTVMV